MVKMDLKWEVTEKLKEIVGERNVIASDEAQRAADPIMVRTYEKAFDYVPEHMPLCTVKIHRTGEASAVLSYCNEKDIHVIARTGGSSSEDQLLVIDDRTIILDALEMDAILKIDELNMVVTVQAGICMETLEQRLNAVALTTGHCPQSRPLASVGGLVATRSTGQYSTYYGGIEDLVCGMEAVLPDGAVVRIRPVPRRSAGPDLRQCLIGSEGAFGLITEVTLKLFPYHPEDMWKCGYVVRDFQTGIDAIRQIMVEGYKPSVVRLYDKADVDENYGSVKLKDAQAFMFFAVEGPKEAVKVMGAGIERIVVAYGAENIGTGAVEHWFETKNNICKVIGTEKDYERFRATKVWNSTIEICANWEDIGKIYEDAMAELPVRIPSLTMLGGHVSHSYINGTNVYFVYAMKISDPDNAHAEQMAFINALCDIVLRYNSGTIVHHHGVGKIRVERIKDELGSSYCMLEKIKKAYDPKGIMNPGCLLPIEG